MLTRSPFLLVLYRFDQQEMEHIRHRKCITSGTSDRLYCCQQSEEVILWLPSRSPAPLA